MAHLCMHPALCLWWGGQGGGAGYKQVVFNISPHWIFFLVIPLLKKVGFWVRVHCGTEFCLHWWSNASSFHFLFLLSRRKLQYWAWTHLALAAGHLHSQGVLRRARYSSLRLWFHFCALQLCTSSWAVHQLSTPYLPSLSLKMQQPFPSQNAKCLWGARIYLLYHSQWPWRYSRSVTQNQVMCLVPLVPAPLHQTRYFCLLAKTNWEVSLWVVLPFPHHRAGKKAHWEKELGFVSWLVGLGLVFFFVGLSFCFVLFLA